MRPARCALAALTGSLEDRLGGGRTRRAAGLAQLTAGMLPEDQAKPMLEAVAAAVVAASSAR